MIKNTKGLYFFLALFSCSTVKAQFKEISHVQSMGGSIKSAGFYKSYCAVGEHAVNSYRKPTVINGTIGFLTREYPDIHIDISEIPTHETALVHCYPNPNKGIFSIEVNTNSHKEYSLRVFDFTGRIIYAQEGNVKKKLDIDLSGSAKGIYFAQVNDGEGIYSKRIVIE